MVVTARLVQVGTSAERRAQPRLGAILGRSMRIRSSWLRCLRSRRPDDPDEGANLLSRRGSSAATEHFHLIAPPIHPNKGRRVGEGHNGCWARHQSVS
jgi:hypothetical protein